MADGSRNRDKVVDIEKFWHRKRRSVPPQQEPKVNAKKINDNKLSGENNKGRETMQNLLNRANALSSPSKIEFKGKYSDPPNPD